jgi:hypothetical protein
MAEQRPSQYPSAGRPDQTTSGWAVGFILFAAIMMIMVGIWQALQGLIAIFENEFYVATRNYLFQFDATTWARAAAITLAVLSAIAKFLFIPYYPFWSLLIIAVDVFVIWAIAAHGREVGV